MRVPRKVTKVVTKVVKVPRTVNKEVKKAAKIPEKIIVAVVDVVTETPLRVTEAVADAIVGKTAAWQTH